MTVFLVLVLLIILMSIGVPVVWSFGAILAIMTLLFDVNPSTLMLQGFRSLNSVILLSLPLFILTGYLMESGGVAKRLIAFVTRLSSGKTSIGNTVVISSAIFGAIAGTATAAVASMGTILSKPASEQGYDKGYVAALLGMSSLLGILIPPSITLILFAVVTRQSVAALFAATLGPAILLIIGLLIYNAVVVTRRFDVKAPRTGNRAPLGKVTLEAAPALLLPVIILGGIYGGIFTPTEAAAVAAVATLLIGAVIYREVSFRSFARTLVDASQTTGSIILILLFSFMISRVLTAERIPQNITEVVSAIATTPIAVILLVNAVLVVAGALMDDLSVTVVIAPLFLPAVTAAGIDPVQYASIVACSVVIGANSPPVAPILYMSSHVTEAPVVAAMRASAGLILCVGLPVLLVTTFWPGLSLAIPRYFGLM
ncbi:TRAP transporter large permease [Aquicoccus sp. SU-CL01552]|uniref:TRAP transporter large permease n=1 Tax=Aquicoccus sp. SU-CL01552 TaxID=3127656 RepID=UPI00310C2122